MVNKSRMALFFPKIECNNDRLKINIKKTIPTLINKIFTLLDIKMDMENRM